MTTPQSSTQDTKYLGIDDISIATSNKEQKQPQQISRKEAADALENILIKIGVGKFNIIVSSLVALGTLMEGAEVSVISILNFVFKEGYWHLSDA